MRIKIILESNDEGGFTAFVPTLPGCVAEGDTADDALASVRAAIVACLAPEDEDLLAGDGGEIREVVL